MRLGQRTQRISPALRNPTATSEAFTGDGWFKTGDVGHLKGRWLYIQGRLKFAIVLSSGLKVFPEDVELTVARYSILRSLCVVGVRRTGGEEVVAVVISDGSDREIDRAISDINVHLESFQHIVEWRRWPDAMFPLTRLRKIDRGKVQHWANTIAADERPRPPTPAGRGDPIVDVILQCMDEPRSVEDADRLSDLGLDSLRRLTVVALIEDEFGRHDRRGGPHHTDDSGRRPGPGGRRHTGRKTYPSSVVAVPTVGASAWRHHT